MVNGEEVQNRPPQDVPLGHVNFELKAIETL